MNPWPKTVFLLLLTLSVERPAVAQLENHTQTYDLTLEDCLAATFRQNPEIQRLRADVEGAVGTRLVYSSRALPNLSAEVSAGGRGGDLYNPLQIKTITNTNGSVFATNSAAQLYPQPFSLMTAESSQPLIDVGIPPSLRRGKLEVVLAQQNLNREVTERLYEARVTFLEALYLRDLIALYDEIDQRLQRNVDSEQQRFDVGMGNEGAVKSARIQELNQKLDLADLRNRYFTAITRLAELAGRDLRNATNAAPQLRLPKPVGALRY